VTDPSVSCRDEELVSAVLASALLRPVLEQLDGCGLPDWFLGAGAVAQTVWNSRYGYADGRGIADLDIVYFEPDTAAELELQARRMVAARLAQVGVKVDVKNQARVHLWYPESFGDRIRPYGSIQDALATWPTTATAVGVRMHEGAVVVYSAFGLSDLFGGVVRANRVQVPRTVYEAKASRWASLWPQLRVLPWEQGIGAEGARLLPQE
jgi:hypothetical protein